MPPPTTRPPAFRSPRPPRSHQSPPSPSPTPFPLSPPPPVLIPVRYTRACHTVSCVGSGGRVERIQYFWGEFPHDGAFCAHVRRLDSLESANRMKRWRGPADVVTYRLRRMIQAREKGIAPTGLSVVRLTSNMYSPLKTDMSPDKSNAWLSGRVASKGVDRRVESALFSHVARSAPPTDINTDRFSSSTAGQGLVPHSASRTGARVGGAI